MFRILALLIFCSSITVELGAQRFRDPRSYYKEFASENRRITIKNIRYLEGVVKGEDPRRVDKYREMVVEQLKESKRAIERLGDYKEDDLLQREYLKALDLFLNAFEKNFDKAEALTEDRYQNFEKLKIYFAAMEAAEADMFDAAYKIQEAEEFFAKKYKVDLRRDEATQLKWKKLDRLTIYTRELSLAFFQVDAPMSAFFKAAEAKQGDTLFDILNTIRQAVRISQDALADMPEFDGKDFLLEELEYYLEEIRDALDETIRPLADQLSNEFLPEDEYEDVQDELEDLKEWHAKARADFFETQTYIVLKYLEE
jgi:hypothetical protein